MHWRTPRDETHRQAISSIARTPHLWVYLLHFVDRHYHAGHYLGSTVDISRRLREHATGAGARLLAVDTIDWSLVRVWQCDSRTVESIAKTQHNGVRFCPLCSNRPRLIHHATEYALPLLGIPLDRKDYVCATQMTNPESRSKRKTGASP